MYFNRRVSAHASLVSAASIVVAALVAGTTGCGKESDSPTSSVDAAVTASAACSSLLVTENVYDGANWWGSLVVKNPQATSVSGVAVALNVPEGVECDFAPSGWSFSQSGSTCTYRRSASSVLRAGASLTLNYSTSSQDFSAASNVQVFAKGCSGSTATAPTTTPPAPTPPAATPPPPPPSSTGTTSPPPASTPGNAVVTEAQFNQMFPNRDAFYTYSGFVAAIASYPGVFSSSSDTVNKQEAAAFLANVSHETGNLQFIRESNQANWSLYCDSGNSQYPCASGQQYYGRGPLQISWNYNYGAAGAVLGLDLVSDPDLVARDATVAWRTAMWFWMTQQSGASTTPHASMVNGIGFGETIRAINGGLECNQGAGSVGNGQMQSRVNFYQSFTQLLGVPTGNNLTC